MWPKVLMQLFELLPHVSRLVPMADKYFSQRSVAEKANQAAFAEMAQGIRGNISQVTKAHDALYRQLQDQNAQIADLREDMRRALTSIEQHDHRLESLNHKLESLDLWIKVGMSIIVVLLAIVIWLLARAR